MIELPQGWGRTRGLVSPIASSGGGGSEPLQVRFKSHYGDLLICRSWSGTKEGASDIYVAKPYLLRRTPFDGTAGRNSVTYVYSDDSTRVATKGGVSVTELIMPYYVENDLIYVLPFRGVFGAITVSWLDINADGRCFSQKTW